MKKERISRKTLRPGVAKVMRRLHFPLDVILRCVRWYVAYSLSLRDLEEMVAEHGIEVDHSTVPMGHQAGAAVREIFSPAYTSGERELADGRDL